MTAEPAVDQRVIATRLDEVCARIDAAARRAGRDPSGVTLVAVSKTFGADVLLEAIAAGVTDLGENRAQELKQKVAVIGDRVRWHFVGHLQTNKVRNVVGAVRLVHSVDRYDLAEVVARRARSLGTVQDALIEVNIADEESKHGTSPESAIELAHEVDAIDGIRVRGLMAMPPATSDPGASRPHFKRLAALRDQLVRGLRGARELSMGMSGDFEVAIEEGATLVRVGEAIFGPRR